MTRAISISSRNRRTGLLLAAGAALGGLAAYWAARARRAERDNPPAGRFLDLDGIRLHYFDRGQGRAVVLLHGVGSMVADFASTGLIERLARDHRVIAFDRPGFGHSSRPRSRLWTPAAQADLIAAAIRRIGVTEAVLVAHSWSVLVALALALRHPQAVRGLVLMGGYAFPTLRLDVPILAPPALPVLGDALRFTISPLLYRMLWRPLLRRVFAPRPIPDHFRAFSRELAIRPGVIRAAAAEAALLVPAAALLSRRYRAIQVPTVVMAGSGDRIVDPAQSERLARLLPRGEMQRIEGVGHMLHHANPDAVLAAIDRVAA